MKIINILFNHRDNYQGLNQSYPHLLTPMIPNDIIIKLKNDANNKMLLIVVIIALTYRIPREMI